MTTPDSALHQRVKGTFVGPVAPRLDQPRPAVVPINWHAYDIPRLYDIVRREDDEIAWQQARGFENLAQLLLSHHDSLRCQRDSLSDAWSPDTSPAAARFFPLLDELIRSMAEDAIAHASTSRGMHAILTALKTLKEQIGQLKREWDRITTDWVPEWWDHAAEDVNRRARELFQKMDATVGDYRQQLVIPSLYTDPDRAAGMAIPEPHSAPMSLARRRSHAQAAGGDPAIAAVPAEPTVPPPPTPGHDPVLRRGPELQGVANVPQPVLAAPGAPISLLPVPPGNIHLPGGGAYVLPGPGIGRGSWVYPMPPSTPAPPGPGGVGPAASPAAGGLGRAGGDAARPVKRIMVWQIACGVPPVIGEASPADALADEQLRLASESFADWFSDLATPWTDDLKVEPTRTEPRP